MHHLPVLWNSLPKQLRQPSAPPSLGTATDYTALLALSSHQFHAKLKTFLFERSFPFLTYLHQLLSVLWPLDLANDFNLGHFHSVVHFHLVHVRHCLLISLHQS